MTVVADMIRLVLRRLCAKYATITHSPSGRWLSTGRRVSMWKRTQGVRTGDALEVFAFDQRLDFVINLKLHRRAA